MSDVIPTKLAGGFLSGYASSVSAQVFGVLPTRPADWAHDTPTWLDKDRRSGAGHIALGELLSVYSRDSLSYQPFCYGIMAGVRHLMGLLDHYPHDQALALADQVVNERLMVVDHVPCVFSSHGIHHKPETETRFVSPFGVPVTDGEAFCSGGRLGLRYSLSLVRGLSQRSPTSHESPYLQAHPILALVAMGDEQEAFNLGTLPKLRDKFKRRPCFYEVELMVQGWSTCSNVLEHVTGIAYKSGTDYRGQRYEAIREQRPLQVKLVELLRSDVDVQRGWAFRLGFGHFELRPRVENQAFDLKVPADAVPESDVTELLDLHQKAGTSKQTSPTWLESPAWLKTA